jgi:arginyl-tRNA synthetase
MYLENTIQHIVKSAVSELYSLEVEFHQIQIQKTRKEFEGDLTVVVFPFVKVARKSPEDTGKEIGAYLQTNNDLIVKFNVIKGFLNLTISKKYWIKVLNKISQLENFGTNNDGNSAIMMVEYSSPNTNKPLHLGHIRNNLLGYSIAEIQKANGWKVVKTNIVNDLP